MVGDGTVFKFAEAACEVVTALDSDLDHFLEVTSGLDVAIENVTERHPHVQLQGPRSRELLSSLCAAGRGGPPGAAARAPGAGPGGAPDARAGDRPGVPRDAVRRARNGRGGRARRRPRPRGRPAALDLRPRQGPTEELTMPIVADHMASNVLTAAPDSNVADAARRMAERSVGAVLVLDGSPLLGICA